MRLLERLSRWVYPPAHPALTEPPSPATPSPTDDPVRVALRSVLDPEFGADIVSMGLIRGVEVEGARCRIRMTLTTRGCPVGPLIVGEVEAAVRRIGLEPEVELHWDPPWSPAEMEPAARERLGR